MKIDLMNSYDFIEYMRKYKYTDKFSNEGLHAMYDWFEEIYDNDDQYSVNANELVIFFSEYETIDEFLKDYYNAEEEVSFRTINRSGQFECYILSFLTEDELIEKISEEYNIIPFKKHGNDKYSLLLNQ